MTLMPGKRDFVSEDTLAAQAIECFAEAIRIDPTFVAAMFHLGLMFRTTGHLNEALQQFSNVLDKQ